ncbi:hypothetical protein EB241_06405 [Erwinia psidii]|uniref:Uncharacterized protein n=1 Tax=Erwinia psidii TaxID=69224 RepID=A0A3N6SJ76_9GAMM|nr:hypothetical protein EB241_06405 [Erwinia psidii]
MSKITFQQYNTVCKDENNLRLIKEKKYFYHYFQLVNKHKFRKYNYFHNNMHTDIVDNDLIFSAPRLFKVFSRYIYQGDYLREDNDVMM